MRIAAIDIGTNSIHMIVVQIRPDLSFGVIDREKEMVRLGAGGLDGRALTPEAMHAALQVLSKFRRLAESHRVDDVIAVATSAVREAENGGEFLRVVQRQTGIRPRVISGTEEARLIHTAAVYGVGVPRDVAVVVDIGGGSVEVTRGSDGDGSKAQNRARCADEAVKAALRNLFEISADLDLDVPDELALVPRLEGIGLDEPFRQPDDAQFEALAELDGGAAAARHFDTAAADIHDNCHVARNADTVHRGGVNQARLFRP